MLYSNIHNIMLHNVNVTLHDRAEILSHVTLSRSHHFSLWKWPIMGRNNHSSKHYLPVPNAHIMMLCHCVSVGTSQDVSTLVPWVPANNGFWAGVGRPRYNILFTEYNIIMLYNIIYLIVLPHYNVICRPLGYTGTWPLSGMGATQKLRYYY